MAGRCGTQRGRGQRRDRGGEAEAEHEDRGQDPGRVAGVPADEREQGEAGAHEHRSDAHLQPRADPRGECTRSGGQRQHDHGQRQQRHTGFQRRVPGHLLQGDRQQEHGAAERAVHHEGDHVRGGELGGPEQVQRQHRWAGAPFPPPEGGEQHDTGHERGGPPTGAGTLDEPVRHADQSERDQRAAGEVDRAGGVRIVRLGDVPPRHDHDQRRDRQVDGEDKPPGHGRDPDLRGTTFPYQFVREPSGRWKSGSGA